MVRVTEVNDVLVSYEEVEPKPGLGTAPNIEVSGTFHESWVCGYYEQPDQHGEVFARISNKTWNPVAHVMATEDDNETG